MEVFAELKAVISDFQAKMGEARAEMAETEDTGSSKFSALGSAASIGLLAVGAAAFEVGKIALEMGEKYQASTAQLASYTGVSEKAAEQIGKTFLDTAFKSTFSAQQIMSAYAPVSAQLELVAGHALNNQQAMTFMSAAMDLAEGTGQNLAAVTGNLATVMQAYGLGVNQSVATSDLLFNVSTKTGVSMQSLTQTLQRLHTQMGANTPSLAQTGGLLLDLTTHGETGRAAMSALSTAFNGIEAPTAAVEKAQKALGVSFVTSSGQMLPIGTIIADLHTKLAGMGDAEAVAELKTLGFGTAGSKLLEVIRAGPAVFAADTEAASKTGTAHAAAAAQAHTLEGEIKTLKAGVDDLTTRLGLALIPILTNLLSAIGPVTRGVQDMAGAIKDADSWVNDLSNDLHHMPGGGKTDILGSIGSAIFPHLAAGGLITSPTFAMLGESGPEAVIPLGGNGIPGPLPTGGYGGQTATAGGGDLVIQVNGQEFARVAGPDFRNWLITQPGRGAARIL